MRWVSYTRSISSRIGEENPANTIAEQNANIEQYLKNKGYRISEKYSDRKRSAEAADGFDRIKKILTIKTDYSLVRERLRKNIEESYKYLTAALENQRSTDL